MILYFSGTGNSRYAAEALGKLTGDEVLDSLKYVRKRKSGRFSSDRPYVFVCPTYAWRIPRIFEKWIRQSVFQGSTEAYFVMTCGGDIGNAKQYLKRMCRDCGMIYKGVLEVVMPENYTAMFPVPDQAESDAIIIRANHVLEEAAAAIKCSDPLKSPEHGVAGKISSGPVNPLFYKVFVKAKGFWVKESCVGCGKCAQLCPMQNISLKDKKPVWGAKCTHCMACINACPAEAIEYKKASIGKRRYYNNKRY